MFKYSKQIIYTVSDIAAAKNWYSNFLGMDPVFDSSVAVAFLIGETFLVLSTSANPLQEDNGRVRVYWEVDDVDETLCKNRTILSQTWDKIPGQPRNL